MTLCPTEVKSLFEISHNSYCFQLDSHQPRLYKFAHNKDNYLQLDKVD